MKTTPELIKERRKRRRQAVNSTALGAFLNAVHELGFTSVERRADQQQPSIKAASTTTLSSLIKLGRRLTPMIEQAMNELDRRYDTETGRRGKERKNSVRADILKTLTPEKRAELRQERLQRRVKASQSRQR